MSRPRPTALVALVALLLAVGVAVPAEHARRADAAADAIATVDLGATPTQLAQRLIRIAPPNFPMDPSPKCYVLDNFGDPRSGGRTHQGSDILASLGQNVYAMADGVLTFQAVVGDGKTGTNLSGNLWKLTVPSTGTYYTYAHLSGFAPGLKVGMQVFRGQVIGYVGDTGNAGPGNYHLHFEYHPKGGAAVNPLPYLTIPKSCTVW